jgi:hypothetical protein
MFYIDRFSDQKEIINIAAGRDLVDLLYIHRLSISLTHGNTWEHIGTHGNTSEHMGTSCVLY